MLDVLKTDEDERSWRVAARAGTVRAYKEYETNNPTGRFVAVAGSAIQKLEMEEAEKRIANELDRRAEEANKAEEEERKRAAERVKEARRAEQQAKELEDRARTTEAKRKAAEEAGRTEAAKKAEELKTQRQVAEETAKAEEARRDAAKKAEAARAAGEQARIAAEQARKAQEEAQKSKMQSTSVASLHRLIVNYADTYVTQKDELAGQRLHYKSKASPKALAACIDWSRTTANHWSPTGSSRHFWIRTASSRTNPVQSESQAIREAIARCEQEGCGYRCYAVDVSGRNALKPPANWGTIAARR